MVNGWPTPNAESDLRALEEILRQTFDDPSPPDPPNPGHPERVATQDAINDCRAHDPNGPGPPPYDQALQESYVSSALFNASIAAGAGSNPPPDTWTRVVNDLNHGGGGGSGGPASIEELAGMTSALVAKFGQDLVKFEIAAKRIREWMRENWPRYPVPPIPTRKRVHEIKREVERRRQSGDRGGFPIPRD